MARGVQDYRVMVAWRRSDKRAILESILGRDAVLAVMDLWGYCAERRPDGDLTGMSNRAIAVAAGWPGEPDEFIAALTNPDVELLDGDAGSYRIHDWKDAQPWAAGSKGRSRAARRKAHQRWRADHKPHERTEWCDETCIVDVADPEGAVPGETGRSRDSGHVSRDKTELSPGQPSPEDPRNLTEDPRNLTEDPRNHVPCPGTTVPGHERVSHVPITETRAETVAAIRAVFAYWAERHPDDFLDPHHGLREWRALEDRFGRDKLTVDRLKLAIDGIHLDDWPERERNLTLWHVVKDLTTVQRWIRTAEANAGPVLSETTRGNLKAAQAWLARGTPG